MKYLYTMVFWLTFVTLLEPQEFRKQNEFRALLFRADAIMPGLYLTIPSTLHSTLDNSLLQFSAGIF